MKKNSHITKELRNENTNPVLFLKTFWLTMLVSSVGSAGATRAVGSAAFFFPSGCAVSGTVLPGPGSERKMHD